MKRVAVFGGGMGGLCAAHELIERGFEVDLYERRDSWGGKARSYSVAGTGTEGRQDLPAEHGFRFFPGFYKHVPDTMSRIPFPAGGPDARVSDNLVQCATGQILQKERPPTVFPVRFPQSWAEFRQRIDDLRKRGSLGFLPGELRHFAGRMLRIAVACRQRRLEQYEKIPWWQFVGAGERSEAYQKMLARGLTRSLVAMRAEVASTRTVGDIMLQMAYYVLTPGASSDRLLRGPTSQVWIEPWRAYLSSRGVRFHEQTSLERFELGADQRIAQAAVRGPDDGVRTVKADWYVAAFPVEVMAKVVDAPLAAAAPSLGRLKNLQVAWMNGVQYYLSRDVPLSQGHSIFIDGNWALTAISQPQFWRDGPYPIERYGDGRVRGLLSVDISDWTDAGQYTTDAPASHCSREQVIDEVWAQLEHHLLDAQGQRLTRDIVLSANLDRDIQEPGKVQDPVRNQARALSRGLKPVKHFEGDGDEDSDAEPLLINTSGCWADRPEAATEIANLFLASDYVRTHTDLATMEGANEAGRRAVNALLQASGSSAAPCKVWPLKEPWLLAPLRAIDWLVYQFQRPSGNKKA